jgi:hypothetical protein
MDPAECQTGTYTAVGTNEVAIIAADLWVYSVTTQDNLLRMGPSADVDGGGFNSVGLWHFDAWGIGANVSADYVLPLTQGSTYAFGQHMRSGSGFADGVASEAYCDVVVTIVNDAP